MSQWRNGRRARLRGVWRNPWGFKSPHRHHKRDVDLCRHLFYYEVGSGWNHLFGFSASELRTKVFSLEGTKFLKRKTVDPLNANEQDKSPHRHYFNKYMKYLIVNNTKNKELLEFPIPENFLEYVKFDREGVKFFYRNQSNNFDIPYTNIKDMKILLKDYSKVQHGFLHHLKTHQKIKLKNSSE